MKAISNTVSLFTSVSSCLCFRRVTNIIPGKYGYGRGPYIDRLQTDTGQASGSARPHRQRRSPAADAHHPTARGHSTHMSNNFDPSNSNHPHIRPYMQARAQQPQTNHMWAPLYQPGSATQAEVQPGLQSGSQPSEHQQHQERPYNPLPSSFCGGDHAHYRICNSNV